MDTKHLINAILEEFPQLSEEEISEESTLLDLLGWSSLNIVLVRAKIQDEYGVEISDTDIKSAKTVSALSELIQTALK